MIEMKLHRKILLRSLRRHYQEYRGVLVKKYRDFWGHYVFIIQGNISMGKVYVGKGFYDTINLGTELIIGAIRRKLVNIRPCK